MTAAPATTTGRERFPARRDTPGRAPCGGDDRSRLGVRPTRSGLLNSEDVPEGLREEIETRLRRVCPDWPAEPFAQLVDEVTRVVLKYDYGRDASGRRLPASELPPSY